ncbi:MAG TPA: PHP domain-containing protein [Trueperaceae bacterium]
MGPRLVIAHSHYSLGFGTASVEELVRWAVESNVSALALTDIETLAGQIRFHDACCLAGVKPLTGVELRAGFSRRSVGPAAGRLLLLARDDEGYGNLCRITSRRRRRSETGDPLESLAGATGGLYLLSDDVGVIERLARLHGVDFDSVRMLDSTSSLAGTGVITAAIPEVTALKEQDVQLHRLLMAIRHRLTVGEVRQSRIDSAVDPGRPAASSTGSVRSEEIERMVETFTLDLRTPERIQPRLPELQPGAAAGELRNRCRNALDALAPTGGDAYAARLERELTTIENLGFADYFLAVAEIARGARELRVETAGRGSAAGSLVAFLLGVTTIDPVASGLLFERFLHEQRQAPPDIDLDVASIGRDELNRWVVGRFGRERVAGIAAYSTFRARSAIRAGSGALGISRSKVDWLVRQYASMRDRDLSEGDRLELALQQSGLPSVRQAAPLIRRLLGMPSHLSAHPGGIVIGDRHLDELVPLELAPGGKLVTQYDYGAVERAGFLKIDLLGNHFLSEMQESLEGLPGVPTIPKDDALTWETLDRADTIGCFQVESPAMRSVLRRLPMKRFSDLVAALAVVRPGAAAGASKERYIRRARGEERFRPLELLGEVVDDERYADLRERLLRTNGVLLYDEDIIRLLSAVGGMSLASADALRSALISAGEDPAALTRLGDEFVTRAVDSGARAGTAQNAWSAASRFASYSFAEAHAASYADLAWKAAWLRTHAPLQFGCALLNHHRALYPLRTIAAAIQRWGVEIVLPSVNSSALSAKLVGDGVLIGLSAIKGLNRRTAGDIIGGRPFRDLGKLIDVARPARSELRGLILSGACDELPPLSPDAYPHVHDVVLEGFEGEVPPRALSEVLSRVEARPREGADADEFRHYQQLVRVRNEIEILGMHVTEHPMRLLRAEAEELGCLPATALDTRIDRSVRFAGILAAARRVPTREGELRYLTWEDETGLVEGVLFPAANERLGRRLTTPGPYLMEGTVRAPDGDLQLVVTELRPFHER